jgi:serine/threonine protein kinase
MRRFAPRTALYMDLGGDFDDRTDTAPAFFDERDVNTHFGSHTEVSQHDAHDALVRRFVIHKRLGQGGFGVAFICSDSAIGDAPSLVVKLPTALVGDADVPEGTPLGNALVEESEETADTFQQARAEFRDECRNAERILEPPLMRKLRAMHGPDAVGAPLQHLSPNEYRAMMAERAHWQALPGYAHLHPLLHFDESVPMLLSVLADGSLVDLREKFKQTAGRSPLDLFPLTPASTQLAPPLWHSVARQLASALQFIDTYTELAHIDLKPDNVFFQTRPNGQVHCMLGDYGLCVPKIYRIEDAEFMPGTMYYNPHAKLWRGDVEARRATARAQSFFQYFTTILDMLRMSVVHTKGSGPEHQAWEYLTSAGRSRATLPISALVQNALTSPESSPYRYLSDMRSWASIRPNVLGNAPWLLALEAVCTERTQLLPILFQRVYGVLMASENIL